MLTAIAVAMCKRLRILMALAGLMLAACGGGAGGGSSGEPLSVAPPPDPEACPSNQVSGADASCTCPEGLHEKEGYCIDWAESVHEGAEFLETGYPLAIPKTGGSYIAPLYMKVGNIDQDPELELVYKDGTSPIYAWNHDGTVLDGWPVNASTYLHGKHALVQFDDDPELEVFFGHEGFASESQRCELNAFDSNGARLAGWPQRCGLSVDTAPVVVDLNGDGYDEVIYFDDNELAYIDRTGTKWVVPIVNPPSRSWCGIAVADVTIHAGQELALVNCSYPVYETGKPPTYYLTLYLLSSEFAVLPGFPITYTGLFSQHPVIADLDADGEKEIMVLGSGSQADFEQRGIRSVLRIVSGEGTIESKIEFTEQVSDQAALGDIDQDGTPEILILVEGQSNYLKKRIHAYEADGKAVPGWPVSGGQFAIGDVDGDRVPEVVTFLDYDSPAYSDNRNVLAIYSGDGTLRENLHVTIDYMGHEAASIMPVIADIDLDGRNELIAIGDFWEGYSGDFPQVWAFDFMGSGPYGPIEWGQLYGNERNTGEYAPH